jgi:hypothetical protein
VRPRRLGFVAPIPFVGLFAAGSMNTVAIVAGIVVLVLAALAFTLIVNNGVAPKLEWGKLKLGFERLQASSRREPPADKDEGGSEQDPDRELTPSWERKRTLRERVLSLPCGRGQNE